jgi:hypothetical protein
MSSPIRRSVIRRIAERKRCSFAVASHIYWCKPIGVKQRLCEEEKARQLSQLKNSRQEGL